MTPFAARVISTGMDSLRPWLGRRFRFPDAQHVATELNAEGMTEGSNPNVRSMQKGAPPGHSAVIVLLSRARTTSHSSRAALSDTTSGLTLTL